MSFEDSVRKKVYVQLKFWLETLLCLSQFQGFSQGEESANHGPVLDGLLQFFLSCPQPRSSRHLHLSNLIIITVEGVQSLFFFLINTNTESHTQNNMSLFQQPKVTQTID